MFCAQTYCRLVLRSMILNLKLLRECVLITEVLAQLSIFTFLQEPPLQHIPNNTMLSLHGFPVLSFA